MMIKNVIFMENNIVELKPLIAMGALDLKQEIVDSLEGLEEKYLKVVHNLIRSLQEEEVTDWWDELSQEEKNDIDLGVKQLKEGKGIPHEQVMAEARELLRKNEL